MSVPSIAGRRVLKLVCENLVSWDRGRHLHDRRSKQQGERRNTVSRTGTCLCRGCFHEHVNHGVVNAESTNSNPHTNRSVPVSRKVITFPQASRCEVHCRSTGRNTGRSPSAIDLEMHVACKMPCRLPMHCSIVDCGFCGEAAFLVAFPPNFFNDTACLAPTSFTVRFNLSQLQAHTIEILQPQLSEKRACDLLPCSATSKALLSSSSGQICAATSYKGVSV